MKIGCREHRVSDFCAECMEEIVKKVIHTIDRQALIIEGDKVLVGFSGGPDSVALLHILHGLQEEFKFKLAAVYIDHKLRPRAAKREARFCKEFCLNYLIPFSSEEINIPDLSQKHKAGIEETARAYRYKTLERIAGEKNYTRIAVGHHRDDRAETVLFNMLRGSGRMGIAGMPPRRGKIIRPLYDISRLEIADYLEEHGLKYMIDRSNLSRQFTRNRIRRKIIPVLKREVTEAAVENIIRFSEIIADEERFLGSMTSVIYDKTVSFTPGGKIRLDLTDKLEYDVWLKRRLVFKILVEAGFIDIEFAEIDRLTELIDGEKQTRVSIREGYTAELAGESLYVYRPGAEIGRHEVALPGTCRLNYPRVCISFEYVDNMDVEEIRIGQGKIAFIDAEKLQGTLFLSGLEPGARFHPFGRPGTKKVGDFLTDQKYPRPLRDEMPVLYDGQGVVWLAGLEIDNRVKVDGETGKIVKVEIGKV